MLMPKTSLNINNCVIIAHVSNHKILHNTYGGYKSKTIIDRNLFNHTDSRVCDELSSENITHEKPSQSALTAYSQQTPRQ